MSTSNFKGGLFIYKVMKELEVGDKLVLISHQKWGNNMYYNFSEVERLTKTQAILKDGTKLIKEPVSCYDFEKSERKERFMTYGDRWRKWQFVTDSILEDAKKENHRQKVNNWFSSQKFTQEQILEIYNLFNK